MLKGSHIYILIALLSTLLFGCGRQIPNDVIDPDKMENILYDYHLAKVMGNDLPSDQNYKKELYIKYVFDKYKISSAQFDSSMVWYAKHADELAKIYANVNKRYLKNGEQLNSPDVNLTTRNRLSGDTLDIWNKSKLFWLTPSELTNKMTFNIVADTSFRKTDIYIMEGDFSFLKIGKQQAVMALNITLDNDSVIGLIQRINYSGSQMIFLSTYNLPTNVRSVNGFIYYKGDKGLPGMLANNLSLKKIHTNVPTATSNEKDQSNSSKSEENEVIKNDTMKKVLPSEVLKPMDIHIDSTNIENAQPLKNDPRSIRDRSPKKIRKKIN